MLKELVVRDDLLPLILDPFQFRLLFGLLFGV